MVPSPLIRVVDSYASLLVLLLANFFLLELVDDLRWGAAYVLIGLLFAFLYLAVDDFRDSPFFAQPGEHDQGEFLYFSFVALTTLGFGDLSPSVGLPQALTVIEALIGSVFLVTLVARLVTLWVRQG